MADVFHPARAAAALDAPWRPSLIGQCNDHEIKVARLEGPFVWHHHEDTDELFFVLRGTLRIELRDRVVTLATGEAFVVARGVEHRPVADEPVEVMLIERVGTRNTGNVVDEHLTAP